MTRGHVLPDVWLNIPQAVVLEATGDLERAKALEARDTHLLLIKAIQLLPPIVSASIDADANDAEARSAFRTRFEEADVQTARGGYERGLRRVCDKLMNGVTAKGSRAPHLPLEIIDPAEFARLEFRIVDAVDPRTGKTVWYGVLINARELAEGGSQDLSSTELSRHAGPPDFDDRAQTASQPGSPTTRPPLLSDRYLREWHEKRVSELMERGEAALGEADWEAAKQQFGGSPTTRPPLLSDRDLREWYEKRVSELMERGEAASGEADWEAAKQQFGGRVTRARLRELREQLAPVDWKKQGRRSIKAK